METIVNLTYEQLTAFIALCIVAAAGFSLAFTVALKGIKNAGKNKVIRKHIPADRTLFGMNEPNKAVCDLLASCKSDGKQPVSIVIEINFV